MRLPSYQDLSKEQDQVNNLPLDGSYLVVGPPGTGKTTVALYRAQRMHRRGDDVLLLTHQRLLSQYMDSATSELEISGVVKTFHAWFASFYKRRYGVFAPQIEPYVFDWPAILIRVNSDPPKTGEIPYLIIDEAQDIPKEFFVLARLLATHITVFADENQRITEQNSTIKDIQAYGNFKDEPYRLTRNYRNTLEIAQLADYFAASSTTGRADPPTRRGDKPKFAHVDKVGHVVEQIARFEQAHSDLEIGIFTPTKRVQTKFLKRLEGKTKRPVQWYVGGKGQDAPVLDFDTPGIKVVNYASTKGLEFDAVFIPEVQLADKLSKELTDMQLHVMVSRAREHLFISCSGEGDPALKRRLPTELVEWQ